MTLGRLEPLPPILPSLSTPMVFLTLSSSLYPSFHSTTHWGFWALPTQGTMLSGPPVSCLLGEGSCEGLYFFLF